MRNYEEERDVSQAFINATKDAESGESYRITLEGIHESYQKGMNELTDKKNDFTNMKDVCRMK